MKQDNATPHQELEELKLEWKVPPKLTTPPRPSQCSFSSAVSPQIAQSPTLMEECPDLTEHLGRMNITSIGESMNFQPSLKTNLNPILPATYPVSIFNTALGTEET